MCRRHIIPLPPHEMWGRDRRAHPHISCGGVLKTRAIRVSRRDTTSKNNVSPCFFTITKFLVFIF